VTLVRERTIPTERPPLFGEVSATFADRGVSRDQRPRSPTVVISVFLALQIIYLSSLQRAAYRHTESCYCVRAQSHVCRFHISASTLPIKASLLRK
jgi:hypothetical protein